MEEIQRISTKALIRKDGKVLMVCEPNGKWELPGGKPDFGEHMEDTIRREIKEELSLDSKVTGLFGQLDFISKVPAHDTVYQFVIFVFSVELLTENIKLSSEHTGYRWFLPADIIGLDIKPEYKEFLKNHL